MLACSSSDQRAQSPPVSKPIKRKLLHDLENLTPEDSNKSTGGAMDDLMDMFAIPSWPEMNAGKLPWDYGTSSSSTSMEACLIAQKSLSNNWDAMGQDFCDDDAIDTARAHQQHSNQHAFISSTKDSDHHSGQIRPNGMQTAYSLQRMLQGSITVPGMRRSTLISRSGGGNEIAGSPAHSSEYHLPSSKWRQPCIEGVPSPLPGYAQVKTEAVEEAATNEMQLIRKRFRDEEQSQATSQESMFNTFPLQQYRIKPQQLHLQVQAPAYVTHNSIGHSQGATPVVAGTARPRVRARRGQATDPHSIAERLRRERIAERIKQLQDLVPIFNKTDKAAMVDEVIEYVQFLQLQVKVFSISRLGSIGAVGPLVSDVPQEGHMHLAAVASLLNTGNLGSSQDNISAIEQQVSKLMEEDMGSALQFLQKKGLCLMRISLALSIAASSNIHSPIEGSGQGTLPMMRDALSSVIMASSSTMSSTMLMSNLGEMITEQGRELPSPTNDGSKASNEGTLKTSPL